MTVPTPPAVSEAMREAVARYFDGSAFLPAHQTGDYYRRRRWEAYAKADAILAPSGPIASEIARLTGEANDWKRVARGAGVCMTCALGAPDTFGCTDCLNTGFEQGAPQGYVPEGYHAETVARLTASTEVAEAALSRLQIDRDAAVALAEAAERNLVARIKTNATALAEAEARGRRRGLEEADAKNTALRKAVRVWIEALPSGRRLTDPERHLQREYSHSAAAICSLATTPAETQKPETANLTDWAS